MREHFVPEHICHKLRAEFDSFTMADDMTVTEYYHRFLELSRYAEDMQLGQQGLALHFEKGLATKIMDRLPAGVLSNLKEVYARFGHAKRLADLSMEAKERNTKKRKVESESGNQSGHKKSNYGQSRAFYGGSGYTGGSRAWGRGGGRSTSDNSNLTCFNYGGVGHKRHDCTSARVGGGFSGAYQGKFSQAPSQSFASNRPSGSWGNRGGQNNNNGDFNRNSGRSYQRPNNSVTQNSTAKPTTSNTLVQGGGHKSSGKLFMIGKQEAKNDAHVVTVSKTINGNSPSFATDFTSDISWQVDALVNNCKLELIPVKRIYEDLFFHIPQTLRTTTSISVHDQALSEENVQKVLSILDPQIKERLHRCLRENCDLFPVSGTNVGWLQKNPRHLLPTSNHRADSRRQLADEQPHKSTSQEDTFVIPIPVPPDGGSDATKDHQSDGQTTILVAVVVTAVATSFVSIILFLCCHKALAGGSGLELKDDRPLLSLSMSDNSIHGIVIILPSSKCLFQFSSLIYIFVDRILMLGTETADPSSKTWAYENSGDKEKSSSQLFSSSFTDTTSVVSSGDKASVETIATRFSTDSLSGGSANEQPLVLKPPPGRIILSSPGLLPLKPPPGRPDLLPPVLPVSLKPASVLNNPPPPPPPPSRPPPPPPSPRPPAGPPPPPPPLKPPAGPPPPPPPKKAGPPSPGPPPPPPPRKSGAHAPPPPKAGATPPRPPPFGVKGGIDVSKTKLKPFFWDKVMANPDHAMVWDQIKAGSFQFNEEMIESLFGYVAVENKNEKKKDSSLNPHPGPQPVQLIEQKKAQNLSILLRALNVTTKEVSDALQEGNELPSELLETLIKMAPTIEEELKLRLFDGELSQLGLAERFLKEMVDIPFAFRRIEVLLFMSTLREEATIVQENLVTLEAACKELRNSRLFLKLLEAVLKTGNRMNDGTYRGGAQAFKLDTLLKLADVKGTDGKTTLLHFVVQEIIRYEGKRAARNSRESTSMSSIKSEDFLEDIPDDSEDHFCNLGLQVVSGVGDQLHNVKKSACIDSDSVTGTIVKLGTDLLKAKNFLNKEMNDLNEDNGFHKALRSFIQHAEGDVMQLLEEEKRIMALVKSTVDYFHGSSGKEEGLRLFVIVRDFLIMLEKVCREVKAKPNWPKPQKKEPPSRQTSTETPRTPFSPDFRQRLFPAIAERRVNSGSSSDDD
ncbi:uncharacterized protein LOC141620410 [Silene latifolia]|uniref:uncharacterized protein LOC141620410 n=1 Tax=Silene latifolia TaxID=37657 RepID=UPI003D78461C